jgi:class 3 adenylate cyclase
VIADAFDDVSILFADIVGFTTLSERISPEEMVPWLKRYSRTLTGSPGAVGLRRSGQ